MSGATAREDAGILPQRPLRVLFVTGMHATAQLPSRGIIIHRLAVAIRQRGHTVEMLELGEGNGLGRYVRARPRVRAVAAVMRPDLVHVYFGYSGLAVPHLAVPIVSSFLGDDLNGTWTPRGGTTFKSRLGVLLSQYLARRSRRCIIISEQMRSGLWGAGVRAKAVVVRDAVDPLLFYPRSRDEARARLGVVRECALIIFPHRASDPNKRLWLAQAAVEALRRTDPDAELWIVNDVPPDEMPWYYAAADAMIVTSAHEGGPSSAKEALACGLAVASVPVGDVQLAADAPDAMWLAEPVPGALAVALREALRVAREPRRSRLPAHLTLPAAAQAIEAIYQEVLQGA